MDKIAQQLKAYIDTHPFDSGDSDCETVLDQLYQAYAESHESDPPEIRDSFKELDELLGALPLDDNNAVLRRRSSVTWARSSAPMRAPAPWPCSSWAMPSKKNTACGFEPPLVK